MYHLVKAIESIDHSHAPKGRGRSLVEGGGGESIDKKARGKCNKTTKSGCHFAVTTHPKHSTKVLDKETLTDRGIGLGWLVVGDALSRIVSSSDEEPSSMPTADGPLLTGQKEERIGGVALPAKDLADLRNPDMHKLSKPIYSYLIYFVT